MSVELKPGMGQVIRFPIERRVAPSMLLLSEIAPDPREVDMAIEAFGFGDCPHYVREDADEAMADYIASEVWPEPGPQRRAALDALLRPLVARAVALCREAQAAAREAAEARRLLVKARREGGYWLEPLEQRAAAREEASARLMVDAYVAKQEAVGAGRAIDLARRSQAWSPLDLRQEAWNVFFPGQPMPATGW